MKKIFRAQDESHVEKRWVPDKVFMPKGWYASKEAALAAWVPIEKNKKARREKHLQVS